MKRWKCTCAYDGGGFCGWQSQASGTSVQDVLEGRLAQVLGAQLDPYCVAPLGIDARSLAALQARAMIDAGLCTERDLATVAARAWGGSVEDMLGAPYVASPLRAHDCAPAADGAAAAILVAGDRARASCARPAWIRGIDHRIDAQRLNIRSRQGRGGAE